MPVAPFLCKNVWQWKEGWMDGGWMDGWMGGKAGIRIAYSNQKCFTLFQLANSSRADYNEYSLYDWYISKILLFHYNSYLA